MTRARYTALLPLAALVALGGCLAETSFAPDVGGLAVTSCEPEDSDPATDVSFSRDIAPIFESRCHTCHSPPRNGYVQTGLVVIPYAELAKGGFSGEDMLVPGDPCSSPLLVSMSEAPRGARMPIGGAPLGRYELQLVSDWIAEGARDN